MSTANELQIELFMSLTDCDTDNIPHLLLTTSIRSSTRRHKEFCIRLYTTVHFSAYITELCLQLTAGSCQQTEMSTEH